MAEESTTRALLRQYGPTILFGVLTLVGIVFIWIAKLANVSNLVVTIIPIGIMCVYFAVSLVAGTMRIHNEQAGDNLYYMGFLFTLSSLGVSLYRFVGDVSIDDIVRNFGIAITSTICGITFRILFNQVRRDPIDIERSVRHELAEMTRRVRTELETSSMEFSSYRRTSNQMLIEGFEEISLQAERTGQAIHKSIEALARDSLKPIADAATSLAKISDGNLKIVEQRAAKANEISENAIGQLNIQRASLSEAVGQLKTVVEVLSSKVDRMKADEEAARTEMTKLLSSVGEALEKQTAAAANLATKADEQVHAVVSATRALNGLPEQIGKSLQPIAGLSKLVQETSANLLAGPWQQTPVASAPDEAVNQAEGPTKEQATTIPKTDRPTPTILTASRNTLSSSVTDEKVQVEVTSHTPSEPTDGKSEPADKAKKGWFSPW